jgi:hypothetical protein
VEQTRAALVQQPLLVVVEAGERGQVDERRGQSSRPRSGAPPSAGLVTSATRASDRKVKATASASAGETVVGSQVVDDG